MTDVMPPFTIFLGGSPDPALPDRIAQGRHPRVEYLEMLAAHTAGLVSFEEVRSCPSPIVRSAWRQGGPYWAMAAYARVRPASPGAVVTTGEDVGWPLALVQKITAGRLPVYVITHGSYLASKKAAPTLKVLRAAPQVVFLCLSESLRACLIETHRIPAERAVNAGYGVDTRFFQPAPLAAVLPRQVASAGTANRDYRTLASASADLDVTVKIAADSSWFRSDLDIAGHDLPANVEARSYGDYAGLRRLYAESAFVVVPLYEARHACGYAVIAEAMAMGKPVITTAIAGRSDYVIDGETGFYVPPGDPAALRDRMAFLLERPDLAARMGQRARQVITEQFTLEAYTARLVRAMRLAPAHPAPRPEDAAVASA